MFRSFERQGKDDSYSLNSSKIRRDLNWKENISIEKGISNIVKWGKIRREKEILKLPWNYARKNLTLNKTIKTLLIKRLCQIWHDN